MYFLPVLPFLVYSVGDPRPQQKYRIIARKLWPKLQSKCIKIRRKKPWSHKATKYRTLGMHLGTSQSESILWLWLLGRIIGLISSDTHMPISNRKCNSNGGKKRKKKKMFLCHHSCQYPGWPYHGTRSKKKKEVYKLLPVHPPWPLILTRNAYRRSKVGVWSLYTGPPCDQLQTPWLVPK